MAVIRKFLENIDIRMNTWEAGFSLQKNKASTSKKIYLKP